MTSDETPRTGSDLSHLRCCRIEQRNNLALVPELFEPQLAIAHAWIRLNVQRVAIDVPCFLNPCCHRAIAHQRIGELVRKAARHAQNGAPACCKRAHWHGHQSTLEQQAVPVLLANCVPVTIAKR